ncbi:MAG: HAMP domain-containing histidine kinase [Ruminococcaceae bacterium]|nr:HAMP domain-containing histidine kinase [Oscillospiraceae bacterium]
MKQFFRRFRSLYWQQFLLIAGVVLLTLLLLGASFYALSYNYTLSEKRGEMRDRAQLVARLSAEFFVADGDESIDQEETLRRLAGVASLVSDVDFLICNDQGNVLLTSDDRLVGRVVTVPADIMADILGQRGRYEGRTTVGDIYEQAQFVEGVPIPGQDAPLGVVLAVMDAGELMEVWRSFIALFLVTAAIILMVAFVASSVMSMRQIQPISEMVRATRAYAAGDLDVRIHEDGRDDEIGELAASFNLMADSLAETERQRRDFIANISHELKTPMTTIAGYTDGILDGTIPPEKERHYLQIISDESRRLSRLVRRMLDVSQIQSLELKMEEFDLCESMRLALLSMEQKINDRGLDVQADIPEDSVMVLGDNDLITQVIYNLLENAAKFAAPASTLYLGVRLLGEKAMVSVRNAGATIPPEEIPLLFERFHKSDKSRSEDKDGYGLGLYIVRTILAQHKEKISVTSEDGVTTFTFTMQTAHAARPNG